VTYSVKKLRKEILAAVILIILSLLLMFNAVYCVNILKKQVIVSPI
jgi:hypothetical protein